jgi:circadian clock protein KaiC
LFSGEDVAKPSLQSLKKAPTGIAGLDEITRGGLPAGRPTLVCGTAGCGKSIFGLEFLFRGATQFGEPGVLVSFEERPEDIAVNVASLGFDVKNLIKTKKLIIDQIKIDRNNIEETGDYNLDGLFIRLGHAIDSIGARRVVLDTIENLFSALSNQAVLRSELRRLFEWLKERNVTAVITGERGDGALTRHGLEEYVSDCVILLDHRIVDQTSTRRLRIVKYRGSTHGMNEYPFLIDDTGFSVIPITSMGLNHTVSRERVSTGMAKLDEMLGGKGLYRGSSVLVSGTPGTGKSTVSARVADAACARGERCLYFAFEESADQIQRNMRSVGVDLSRWIKRGLLKIVASRPTTVGLEMHLAIMHKTIGEFRPRFVVVDPINNLITTGSETELRSMLTRLVDFLKSEGITAVLTSLTVEGRAEQTDVGLSSLMDTWILLRNIETRGVRNRGVYVLKSRGMPHSNEIRKLIISARGIDIVPFEGASHAN